MEVEEPSQQRDVGQASHFPKLAGANADCVAQEAKEKSSSATGLQV